MPIYLVTYDLNKESSPADYKPLWDALNKLGAHRVLESVWLVNVTNTAKELHEHFKAHMDSNMRPLRLRDMPCGRLLSVERGSPNGLADRS